MKKLHAIIITLFVLIQFVSAQTVFSVSEKPLRKHTVKSYPMAQLQSIGDNRNGRFYKILDNNKILAYAYTGRVNSCRAGGCSLGNNEEDADMEYFDYYAVFNVQKQIVKLAIFNYQATHGQAVCSRAWLKQFLYYDGSKQLKVGHNIDAISGATISSNAFTSNIQDVCIRLQKL